MKNMKYCRCGGLKGWIGALLWLLAVVAVVLGWLYRDSVTGYMGLVFADWMFLGLVLTFLSYPCLKSGRCPCGGANCDCGGKGCGICK